MFPLFSNGVGRSFFLPTGYGKYFKVGLVEDLDYKDELKRFVRFWSSKSGDNQTSLDEYISRMKDLYTLGFYIYFMQSL